MRFWTVHIRSGAAPILVRESWSFGAFLLGPLWLLANRAWIPAIIDLALLIGIRALPDRVHGWALLAHALLLALLGRDLVRWSLARRGYALHHVVAARDEEAAFGRLLDARRDLVQSYAEQLR